MKAIDILLREHDLIRQVLDDLSIAIEKLEMDERPPKEFFEKAVEFARKFADEFHHFKEEYIMFGLFAQKKDGALDGQIDALRYQHERGRNFVVEIAHSLDGYAKGDELSTTTLLENLASYISLLRRHIHKEDHAFYPMVERDLTENEGGALLEQFKKEEERIGDKDFFENNSKLVHEMSSLLGT
jgi:hemerythrin-like domain-containing protein